MHKKYGVGYKEIRLIFSQDLMKLCKNKKWYTQGSKRNYERLLKSVDEYAHMRTEDIVGLAEDITYNSNFDDYDITEEEFFKDVCLALIEICRTHIKVIK
jgi:hypothetical protein